MRSQVQISVDTKALGDFFSCVVASVNRVSYLILVVGERGKISHGVSRGAHKLTQPPRLSKKKREQKGWGGSLALRLKEMVTKRWPSLIFGMLMTHC